MLAQHMLAGYIPTFIMNRARDVIIQSLKGVGELSVVYYPRNEKFERVKGKPAFSLKM